MSRPKKHDHGVIIRLDYGTDERSQKEFDWRIEMFQEYLLKSLLCQTEENFDIVIRCNPAHAAQIEALSPRIRTFSHEGPTMYKTGLKGIKTGSRSIPAFKYTPEYKIQTRIDSDDFVSCDFVERINKEFHVKKNDALILFRHLKFDTKTERWYKPGLEVTVGHPGPFLSLFQPEPKIFIYEYGHTKIGNHFEDVKIIDDYSYCSMLITEHNASTVIRDVDTEYIKD